MLKKLVILICTGLLVMSGCSNGKAAQNESTSAPTNASDESTELTSESSESDISTENSSESEAASSQAKVEFDFEQLKPPKKGEEIAILKTNMGTIKLRLFPEIAPKAVKNFKGLAKKGVYNNLIFHRVINNFMIQGGDPNKDGTGGTSIYGDGKAFEDEFSLDYRNFRGALCMANSGPNTNQSQFFIVQAPADTINENLVNQMIETNKSENAKGSFSDEVVAAYKSLGGTPWLDFGHTVFGQVFEGMDVVDQIAAVETVNDKPVSDVVLESVTIEKYNEK